MPDVLRVFKAKVALAAFAGDTMLADLAQRFLSVEIGAGRAGALVRL